MKAKIEIETWFLKREGINEKDIEADITRTTEKAILIEYQGREIWVPKSLIIKMETENGNKL